MNSYLAITPKYLAAHRRNTRLTIVSVLISVALVTTIFSMLDVFWQFEKQQILNDYGNYHILVKYITDEEAAAILGRLDVDAATEYMEFDGAEMNGVPVEIATGESIEMIYSSNFRVVEGAMPEADNEVVVEQWAAENYRWHVYDTVRITSERGVEKEFRICGICTDFSSTKAEGIPGLLVTLGGARSIGPEEGASLIVRFKDRVNISRAEQEIKQELQIPDDRIAHNERLLAMMLQSRSNMVLGLYGTGAILFALVLVAGVTMICNTFNISVMDRVRQFGLLRCIGASKKQIRTLVRKEGRIIALWAIPPGIVIGILISVVCSAILKYYNHTFFAEIPLFSVSAAGILAGIATGVLTVFFASLAPAKRASRVSPVSAVSDSGGVQPAQRKRHGFFTGSVHVETALGIRNAFSKKKTLILMSASIAISIVMFLGFQVFVSFLYSSMKTNKPYTPDVELVSDGSLDVGLYTELSALDGVKRVYGRMYGYVDASFDVSRLTGDYRQAVGDISVNADGSFHPPETSWLISYNADQLKWAKTDLVKGTLSEDQLNEQNGIIAVLLQTRNGVSMQTTNLQLGDRVTIQTVSGPKAYTVMAILRSVPFSDDKLSLTTFLTTEKLYTEITGDTTFDVIDIQLKRACQEETVSAIKSRIGSGVKFLDARQRNAETTQAFLTVALFVYGFVLVIALISVLNIINTMQTSVSAKTRYLGVLRAVGMSGRQMDKMMLAEAGTYSATGCAAGIALGTLLQKLLVTKLLSGARMSWEFPLTQVVVIVAVTLLVTLLSVVGPLKKVKSRGISETIGSL